MGRWFVPLAIVVSVFAMAGAASAHPVGSADTLQEVRFGDHVSYERAVLDLGWDQVPADYTPYYWWTRIDGGTILRVHLPTVSSTSTTEGEGLGMGISRYYVTRAFGPGGHLDVDLHLTDAAGPVNVFYLNYPARVVIDVPLNGENFYPEPAIGEKFVLTQPREGYTVGPGSVTVVGYGRPFEARGAWRMKDADGEVVSRGSYSTTDWSSAWGRFSFTVDYPASLSGERGLLEVGESSAKDGSFEGVSVPLTFR